MNIHVLIPARMDSTRFPGKALYPILGKPLLDHVIEGSTLADIAPAVITPHIQIADHCIANYSPFYCVSKARCGTERCIKAIDIYGEELGWQGGDTLVNVQGDTIPDPSIIENLAYTVHRGGIATAAYMCSDPAIVNNPNRVKIALGDNNEAVYFSRSPIPHGGPYLIHAGIYAFSYSVVESWIESGYPHQTNLGRIEGLEQLDWGPITVKTFIGPIHSIDTQDDIRIVEEALTNPH